LFTPKSNKSARTPWIPAVVKDAIYTNFWLVGFSEAFMEIATPAKIYNS